jgi:transposase
MPTEAERLQRDPTHEKEHILEQKVTKPSYHLFVGVDIASRESTAASLVAGAKSTRESHSYAQTSTGFERFQTRLQASGIAPGDILIVMEATGSYWIALATTLYHAGYAVSVINPAQAHYFAKAQLKQAKNDVLDAQTIAELAQALIPACWTPPPQIYYELQQRLAQRASLLAWRTQVNNQLHALSVSPVVVPCVRERLVELIDIVNQHIVQLDVELLELPHCATTDIRERAKKTRLVYAIFFCPTCHRVFNERTGSPFNHLEFPTDIVLLAVLW